METLSKSLDQAQTFWLKFVELAGSYPFIAGVFGVIAILFLVSQLKQFLEGSKTLYKKTRTLFFVSVIVVVGLSGAMVMVARHQNIPFPVLLEPAPNGQIIGERALLRWSIPAGRKTSDSLNTDSRYQVEYQLEGAQREIVETFESYYYLKPAPGKFIWRVRRLAQSEGLFKPESRWSQWQTQKLYHSNLQRIRMTREIRIGITKDPIAPYYYFDTNTKSDAGLDREVAELLAREVGRELKFENLIIHWVPRQWIEGIALALKSHQADFAVAQTTISQKREQDYRIKFTIPYLRAPHAIITRKDRFNLLKPNELRGLRVTAWRNTTGEKLARALTTNVTPSDNAPELFHRLNSGEVDAIIDDYFLASYLVRTVTSIYEYNIFRIAKIHVPQTYKAEFGYPDPLGAFVHETSSKLHQVLNTILAKPSIQTEISAIARKYLRTGIQKPL